MISPYTKQEKTSTHILYFNSHIFDYYFENPNLELLQGLGEEYCIICECRG